MRCPSCHYDNRFDRRFCTQCGTKLAAGCPSCGGPDRGRREILRRLRLGADDRRADHDSIASPCAPPRREDPPGKATVEGERKQVTVLFVDVFWRVEIESALERAEHLVASIEGSALSPRILELRGRLAAAVGDAPSSDRTLREALDLYRAIGATGHAERLARELDA
jgi:hypothetical protein